MTDSSLLSFLKSVGIQGTPSNYGLLEQSLTHKSYAMDFSSGKVLHNERLEFLGDAILDVVVAQKLFSDFPTENESQLTLSKIFLVREQTLAECAREINLGSVIRLGIGEKKVGGDDKNSILSDCLEAFIAYISLDFGQEAVETFIETVIYKKLSQKPTKPDKSPKSKFQELIQKKYKCIPEYIEHELEYDEYKNVSLYGSSVSVGTKLVGKGEGKNKKIAQSEAAIHAYDNITHGVIKILPSDLNV